MVRVESLPDPERCASDPRPAVRRAGALRREGPGGDVSADRATAAARRRAERSRHPARRRRLRSFERIRWAVQHTDGRASRRTGSQVQPLPHDGAVRADPSRAPHRSQPSHGRDGRHHRARDVGSRLQLAAAEHVRTARADAGPERLLDSAVRQVPRGAGLADEPARSVRRVADGRRRLRVLLRLHRRRDEPVLPRDLRRNHSGRARQDARGGLPLHRGHDRQGDHVDPLIRSR